MFTYLFTDDKCKVPKGAGMEVGEEGDYVLSLHGQKQNDSCIKTGSDESHFNVLVGSDCSYCSCSMFRYVNSVPLSL